MAVTWSATGYISGTDTSGKISTLAPIPDSNYSLIRGMSWNPSSGNRAIFGDIYAYAERTSATTAKVYLCQRGWIYTSRAANYAACVALTDNNVKRGNGSGYMWGYSTYATFKVTGTSETTLANIYYGSNNANHGIYSSSVTGGGRLYLDNSSRSWWRQLSEITDIPVTAETKKITLNIGAVTGTGSSGYNWEPDTSAWSYDLPIPALSACVNVNGTWQHGKPWVNVNGTWKEGVVWVNVNGTWKTI